MKLAGQRDLKAAITELPIKEKDRLLLRLIAKDKVLTEHLHFKLLEDKNDLEIRKDQIKSTIDEAVSGLENLNAKEALTIMRKMITGVNHFYKVTKDIFGEVELKIYVLEKVPTAYKKKVYGYRDFGYLFTSFYLKTTNITLNKFKKLHEDLQFDLSSSFNSLLSKIHASNIKIEATEQGIPERLN